MASEDLSRYKNQLRSLLEYYGIEIYTKKKPPVIHCLIPGHADKNPSMVVYPDRLWCPVCAESWDIFDAVGHLESTSDFNEKLKYVKRALGELEKTEKKPQQRKKKSRNRKKRPNPRVTPSGRWMFIPTPGFCSATRL